MRTVQQTEIDVRIFELAWFSLFAHPIKRALIIFVLLQVVEFGVAQEVREGALNVYKAVLTLLQSQPETFQELPAVVSYYEVRRHLSSSLFLNGATRSVS